MNDEYALEHQAKYHLDSGKTPYEVCIILSDLYRIPYETIEASVEAVVRGDWVAEDETR